MLQAITHEPVIVDFGLATVTTDSTYLFVRCGTPGYVAPEILNLKDLSAKCSAISDVFSIGCSFYFMCFGRSVFEGKTMEDVLKNNRNCRVCYDTVMNSVSEILPEKSQGH